MGNMNRPLLAKARREAASQCAAVFDQPFFKAFAEPARVAVFQQVVLLGRADVGTIAGRLPQDRSVVSRHLQVLAKAGILRPAREGRHMLYEVNVTEIEHQLMRMLEITRQLGKDHES